MGETVGQDMGESVGESVTGQEDVDVDMDTATKHGETTTSTGVVTVAEAAALLDVHYMTAYRYIRIGRLPARKDGQTWRIERADVEQLRTAAEALGSGRREVDWADRVYRRVTAFDERGALQAVELALTSGLAPADAHATIIVPVLGRLGQSWADGELSIAEEHAATNICRRLMGRIGLQLHRPGRSKGTIVITCAPGERHGLAAAVAADIFRAGGYRAIDCGGDLPLSSFLRLVSDTPAVVAVGISTTMPGSRHALSGMVAAIRAEFPAVAVLVGGAGVGGDGPDGALEDLDGADIVARSATDGVAGLDRLLAVDGRT